MTDLPRSGLRLHDRTFLIHLNLIRLQEELTLTDVEMLRALLFVTEKISIRLLRAERHPDDPSRKADEA